MTVAYFMLLILGVKHMKKILVIGGGAYQTALIRRLKEQKYYVACVDKNYDASGFEFSDEYKAIDVLDFEQCLCYAKEIRIDAVMTYGATLTLPTVSYIAERLGLPALPMDTAELSKNKFLIKKRLKDGGCNIKGDFFELHSPDEIKKYNVEYPCVLKPTDGSGSKGVSFAYSLEELSLAAEHAYNAARFGSYYCESLIAGNEYSVEAFVADGTPYIYGIVKTTFERCGENNEDIEYGHRTPSGLPQAQEKLIEGEVKKAISALNITIGSANFDVIISEDDGKPYIIDCGIRVGQNLLASHLIPYSRGVSVIDNNIDAALGNRVDAEPKYIKNMATRLLIYDPGIIKEIKELSGLKGHNGITDIVLKKSVGDIQREYSDKSDTCGWVICTGNTPDEAEANASDAKKIIRSFFVIR